MSDNESNPFRLLYLSDCKELSVIEKKAESAKKVKEVFFENRRRYGSRRITKALQAQGFEIGRNKVRRLMKSQNLTAIKPKDFKPQTTQSNNRLASQNLLANEVNKEVKPKSVIIGDITYLPMANGSLGCLASFQDKFTRKVIDWKVSKTMTKDLVIEALKKALSGGHIEKNAIIHRDRGSQYSSNNFRKLLKEHSLRQSMSGKGNCYDNAQTESFFARFKIAVLEKGKFEDLAQAISETFS